MMSSVKIFLYEKLPHERIHLGCTDSDEPDLRDVHELCHLYETKYGQLATIDFHILTDDNAIEFSEALNDLFEVNEMSIKVNPALVHLMADKYLPLIVVDGKVLTQGIYPDLTTLRGGEKSINRGYTGETHCH